MTDMLLSVITQLVCLAGDALFVFVHPSLWRFYVFFQIEYLFFSPYYLAGRQTQGDEVYGFTPLFTACRIMKMSRRLRVKRGHAEDEPVRWIDVGCGDARGVFLAYLLLGWDATGIEKNEAFLVKARLFRQVLGAEGLELIHADLREFTLYDYDIIYLTWTTFTPETVARLTRKLVSEVAVGSIVVTLSFPVESDTFEVLAERTELFSWGNNTVFYQVKKGEG